MEDERNSLRGEISEMNNIAASARSAIDEIHLEESEKYTWKNQRNK